MFMTSALPDATSYPLPAGSRLLQALGFLAFTLPQVEILMSTKNHATRNCPWNSNWQTRPCTIADCIEHVNSRVKRCRIVKDRIRLWKEGVRRATFALAQRSESG
jgi:hypothetical protein